jgi:hypothetical protein
MRSQVTKILGIAILLTSSCVSASIIDNDTYLTDSISGLDWLDLSATSNQARRTVGTRLRSTGDLNGWRYAKRSEMYGLVSRFDNRLGPASTTRLADPVFSDRAGFGSTDPFTDSWSTLFDLLGPTSVKTSSSRPLDSKEFMFGLFDYRNYSGAQLLFSPGNLYMGLAGFSNCTAREDSVNCQNSPQTRYNSVGHITFGQLNRQDYYHLDLSIQNHGLFNQQHILDQTLAQPNINPTQGFGLDLNFGSFLVRSNATPCNDSDDTTLDVQNGPHCSNTPIVIEPPVYQVSEPSTLALMGLAIFGLVFSRRKMKK